MCLSVSPSAWCTGTMPCCFAVPSLPAPHQPLSQPCSSTHPSNSAISFFSSYSTLSHLFIHESLLFSSTLLFSCSGSLWVSLKFSSVQFQSLCTLLFTVLTRNVMHCRLANKFLKLQNISIPHLAVRVITKTLSPCDIGLIGLQPAVPQFLCALPSFRGLH